MSEQSGTGAGGPRGAERRQMGRKHVFAVNDSPAVLDVVRQLLLDEAYNVTTTNYVPRTFEQIAGLAPDLLVLDLAISQRAGWDLLERLHAEAATRAIPVLVTATDHRPAPARAGRGRPAALRRRPLPGEAPRSGGAPRRRARADRRRLTAARAASERDRRPRGTRCAQEGAGREPENAAGGTRVMCLRPFRSSLRAGR